MASHNSSPEAHAAYMRQWRAQRRHEVRPAQIRENSTRFAPLEKPAITVDVRGPKHGLKIAVVPDAQVRPGVPTDHLAWYGKYLADKQPDVILCLGDWADMPSLSTYTKPGDLDGEGLRYRDDIDSAKRAMERFLTPIHRKSGYKPTYIMCEGNHEDRITRAVQSDPKRLQGVISPSDLGYAAAGWQVYPFLQPIVVGGVAFCHYFPSGILGRPITTASAILRKMHMSCFAGHQQGRDIAYSKRADGGSLTAIISGSFYEHDESYLSPFTNRHWRGAYVLHEVKDGSFDEMALSIDFLRRRYGK